MISGLKQNGFCYYKCIVLDEFYSLGAVFKSVCLMVLAITIVFFVEMNMKSEILMPGACLCCTVFKLKIDKHQIEFNNF